MASDTPWAQFRDPLRRNAVLQLKFTLSVAILLLGGLTFIIAAISSKPYELAHATAQFVSQEHVINFFVTTRDKVTFTAVKPARAVTTYIYPQNQVNFKKHAPIPIIYELGSPVHAYFAGPGGDVNDPNFPGYGAFIGFFAVIIGGVWMSHQARWQARMLKLINSGSDQGPIVRAHWHTNRRSSIIVTTSPATPWQLSWKALAIDSRIDLGFLQQLKKAWAERNRIILLSRAQAGANLKVAQPVALRSGHFIFLPLNRAAPITLIRVSAIVNDDDDLATCHRQLISAYADVLNRIRQLPAVFPGRGRRYSIRRGSHFRRLLCWRFMVRLHAEAHIRGQLRNLKNAYIRRQFSSAEAFAGSKEQPPSLQQECNMIIESLSDNSRLIPAIVLVITVMAPIVPLILKVNPVPFYRLLTTVFFFIVAVIVFLPGAAAVLVYADAFRFKRQLFGADLPSIKPHTYKSIYELEDRLYGLLDQPKRSEKAPDLWARAGVMTILWVAIGRLFLSSPHLELPIVDWVFAAIIIFPTWALAKGIWYRRKAER